MSTDAAEFSELQACAMYDTAPNHGLRSFKNERKAGLNVLGQSGISFDAREITIRTMIPLWGC